MEFTDDQTNCELDDKQEPFDMKQTTEALNQSLLHSEVGFWREMLHSSDRYTPAASIERMKHALALAERKFNELLRHYPGGLRTQSKPARTNAERVSGNVHYLSRMSNSHIHPDTISQPEVEK